MLDIEDYKESKKRANLKIGCFAMFIMIILCVTIIMIPVVILLYLILKKQQPNFICPYCLSKNSIIPADTPMGKRLLKENYTQDEILAMDIECSKQSQTINKWNIISKYVLIFWIVIIMLMFFASSVHK